MAEAVLRGPLPRTMKVPGTWIVTTVAPADVEGQDGDFAINTTTGSYWIKEAGAWVAKGTLGGSGGGGALSEAEIAMLMALTPTDWGLVVPTGLTLVGVTLDGTNLPTVDYAGYFDPVMNLAIITLHLMGSATGVASARINQALYTNGGFDYYLIPISANVVGWASYPTPVLNAFADQGVHWSAVDATQYQATFHCMLGRLPNI